MTNLSISQDEVRHLFSYRDGALIRRKTVNYNAQIGDVVGTPDGKGYLSVSVHGSRWKVHRLIFLWHHGWLPVEVDHIKGKDNHVENLRAATHEQNKYNVGLRCDNTSGVKGVTWDTKRNKWFACCAINGKTIALGRYMNIDDAIAVVRKFREEHHGKFANHG